MQVLKGNNSHNTLFKSSKLQPPFNKNLAPQLPRLNRQAFLVAKGHQLISAHRLQLLWLKLGRDSSHRSHNISGRLWMFIIPHIFVEPVIIPHMFVELVSDYGC